MSDDIDPAFKAAWRESQGQPVDAEPRTNYIAEAITEAFGERCPDYEPGCHCCEAWKQYDALAAVSQEPAPVGYVTPDSIREVAAGNIGNHLFPKGTLRPENEIQVYAAPVAAPLVGEEAVERALAAWQQALIDAPDEPVDARRRRCIRAALSASSVAKPVRVKALEWQEQQDSSGDISHWGHHEFGAYAVERDHFSVVPWELIAGGRVIGNFDTVEDAKAAAQADYERRILSCLSHPAQGWRLVPVEPTEEMISEGDRVMYRRYGCSFEVAPIYDAMLAAAPSAPAGGSGNE